MRRNTHLSPTGDNCGWYPSRATARAVLRSLSTVWMYTVPLYFLGSRFIR